MNENRAVEVRPKKKMSGCLVAILVVGGLGVVMMVIVGIVVARWLSSPDGRRIAGAVGETAKVMKDGAQAPGTSELKKGGCRQAFVLDMDRVQHIFDSFADAGMTNSPAKRAVICQGPAKGAPSCDDVAAIYVSAVPEQPGPFFVQVQLAGRNPLCQQAYSAEGKSLGPLR